MGFPNEYLFLFAKFTCCHKVAANVYGLQQVGEIEFLLPGTVAKFIIKSSLFILSLNRDFSARNCCSIMNKKLIVILQPHLAQNRSCRFAFCLKKYILNSAVKVIKSSQPISSNVVIRNYLQFCYKFLSVANLFSVLTSFV